ncbi:MAG: T9SS type A sorting domain-containing protein [Marinilabiliaceae bacterium]|nr:T9SS type A sorting domain-containing protein [Marinilabiliaceae bacterium]
MLKFRTKLVSMALVMLLCSGAIFAQRVTPNNKISKSEIKQIVQSKKITSANVDRTVQYSNPNALQLLGNSRGASVEGWKTFPAPWGYYIFDSEDVEAGEVIWDPGFDMLSGETVNGILYAYDNEDDPNFYLWDAETGELIDFFIAPLFDPDFLPNDFAYDYTTGIMYGLSWNELLIVDLESGEVEVLDIYFESEFGDALVFMAMAIDKNGNAYGVTDFWDEEPWVYEGGILFKIDLETGICERIGDTEIEDIMYYYPECLVFDNNTGKLYWSHLGPSNNPDDWSWREIDIETGVSTYISVGGILSCLSIPFAYESISRISTKMDIYPNPAKNLVQIDGVDILKVEIYNMFGQLVDTQKANTIDVSKYNAGAYLFKTYDVNGNVIISKIMVTK